MRKTQFQNDSFYHLYNRGTDKRAIFLEPADYQRFLRAVEHAKKDLVSITAYTLMPNHFHFLVRQQATGGISSFMHRLGTGYTMYFNAKHERSGTLFQGKFKDVAVHTDEQLLHLSRYIHINCVKDMMQHGRDEKFKLLESYAWSSYPDYLNLRRSSFVDKEFLVACFLGFSPKARPCLDKAEPWGELEFVSQYRNFIREGLSSVQARPSLEM